MLCSLRLDREVAELNQTEIEHVTADSVATLQNFRDSLNFFSFGIKSTFYRTNHGDRAGVSASFEVLLKKHTQEFV